MKMTIKDRLRGDTFVVEDAIVIPRIGESVNWHYLPIPTVRAVRYNFHENTVFVELE